MMNMPKTPFALSLGTIMTIPAKPFALSPSSLLRTGLSKGRKSGMPMLLALALLAGCASGPAPRSNIAAYDFGPIEAMGKGVPGIERIEVRAPSWLGTTAMQYRLAADEPARRRNFAESRWVAPPAELIEAALKQRLSGEAASPGCRLTLEIDEFVQSFDAAGDSRAQLALRASLSRKADNVVLARQAFSLEEGAGRDARGGVVAQGVVQRRLAESLNQWLQASGTGVCKG